MGNSLQEQLLKAGLVDLQKLKQVNTEKRKQTKQPPATRGVATEAAKQEAQREAARLAERDRELNRRREEAAKARARIAEIKQLIETHRLARTGCDRPYHFPDGNKLKRMFITEEMRRQLGLGTLAIAKLGDRYELVPDAVADKIQEREPKWVVVRAQQPQDKPQDSEDPYAAYQVPDDLIW